MKRRCNSGCLVIPDCTLEFLDDAVGLANQPIGTQVDTVGPKIMQHKKLR